MKRHLAAAIIHTCYQQKPDKVSSTSHSGWTTGYCLRYYHTASMMKLAQESYSRCHEEDVKKVMTEVRIRE